MVKTAADESPANNAQLAQWYRQLARPRSATRSSRCRDWRSAARAPMRSTASAPMLDARVVRLGIAT